MTQHPYLLVTTTRAAWVLDAATGLAKRIDQGRGVYYGISFTEEQIFIACRQVDVGADRDSQDNIVLCFDRNLRETGVLHPPFPVRDVHQICCHDGTLYIASTYDDAIVCHSLSGGDWRVWYPFGRSDEHDRHHINSITVNDGGCLLAGNRPHGWAASFARPEATTPIWRRALGRGTHNAWSEGGTVAVCSSDDGAIALDGGPTRAVVHNGWLRGFARQGADRYVGVSQNLVRGVRERSDCMVLRLDESDSILARFSFLGFGMVHDIRATGVADSAHNGIELTLSADSYAAIADCYQTSPDCIGLIAKTP